MTSSDGRLRRRLVAVAAAVGLLVAGVVIGVLVAGGDDDEPGGTEVVSGADTSTTTGDGESSTTSTTGVPVPATPEAEELIALIETGQTATYMARYQTNDPTSGVGTLQVDVWRSGDRLRQDAVIAAQGRTVETSAYFDGDQVRACQRAPGAAWECETIPRAQAGDVDTRIRDAVAELADTTTGGTDTTIAGQPSRCYQVVDTDGQQMDLCVTLSGVPARLVAGDASVELVSLSDSVPEGTFDPPA